jgi:phage FluMu protein Com
LVPIDAGTAAAATQPAHQPPGKHDPAKHDPARPDTIDPLMLGPQPLPKPKVKRDEVAVVCYLCKTRMYAPLELIGQTIKCPDCHSVNEVKAPKVAPEKKKTGPTLDDAPDFGLNDPGDRPAYRPIVAPRGEYSALAEFDPSQRPAGWSHPGQDAVVPATAVARAEDDEDDDVEITIAAPVERIEIKPEIKPLPPPDPDDDLYDGKYDDGLIGDHVDRSAPEAWKKAPLVIGILGFLFYTSTIPRLILYVLGLIFAISIFHAAINYGSSEDPSSKVAAIFFSGLSMVSLGFWVASFAAILLCIVQDTANGQDDVTSYPDWNIVDWIATSAYFPAAAFVAGLPGSVFTVALLGTGLDPVMGAFAAGAPLVISWIALFPLVLYSMLAEGSVMAPYSAATYRSTQQASEGWVFFYMYAILLGILGTISLSMIAYPGETITFFLLRVFGSLGLVVVGMLYCRILGRLMWYSSEKMARLERLEERRRAAAGA